MPVAPPCLPHAAPRDGLLISFGQEWYTNSTDNVNQANGELLITARATTSDEQQTLCNAAPGQCNYTSGRIRTYDKFSMVPTKTGKTKTVRIETRVKLPDGLGLWPSIWMLPEDSPANCSGCGKYGEWAASGAITIAQSVNNMTTATGGILFGSASPNETSSTFSAPIVRNKDSYHTFALEWTLDYMKWFVDDNKVFQAVSGDKGKVPGGWYSTGPGAGSNSPFDQPFYLLLDLAVGGDGTGASASDVAATMAQPQVMHVDFVRVCTKG